VQQGAGLLLLQAGPEVGEGALEEGALEEGALEERALEVEEEGSRVGSLEDRPRAVLQAER